MTMSNDDTVEGTITDANPFDDPPHPDASSEMAAEPKRVELDNVGTSDSAGGGLKQVLKKNLHLMMLGVVVLFAVAAVLHFVDLAHHRAHSHYVRYARAQARAQYPGRPFALGAHGTLKRVHTPSPFDRASQWASAARQHTLAPKAQPKRVAKAPFAKPRASIGSGSVTATQAGGASLAADTQALLAANVATAGARHKDTEPAAKPEPETQDPALDAQNKQLKQALTQLLHSKATSQANALAQAKQLEQMLRTENATLKVELKRVRAALSATDAKMLTLAKDRQIDRARATRYKRELDRLEAQTGTSRSGVEQHIARASRHVHPGIPQQYGGYTLKGASNGVAWLSESSGKLLSVTKGDTVPGLGIVTRIDDVRGVIVVGGHAIRE